MRAGQWTLCRCLDNRLTSPRPLHVRLRGSPASQHASQPQSCFLQELVLITPVSLPPTSDDLRSPLPITVNVPTCFWHSGSGLGGRAGLPRNSGQSEGTIKGVQLDCFKTSVYQETMSAHAPVLTGSAVHSRPWALRFALSPHVSSQHSARKYFYLHF